MTKFIAHRGLSARFPENTHSAFYAAWQADCDGIELDVQVSKDGKVLVIHDPDTARVAGHPCVIAEHTWEDLQQLKVGQGQRIPLLSDVIAAMPADKIVQIELKHHIDNAEGMNAIFSLLNNMRLDIAVQVISFDPDKIVRVQRAFPELTCLFLVPEKDGVIPDPIDFAKQHGLAGLDVAHPLATAEFITATRAANLLIGTWTVNDLNCARKLVSLDVDFIASDIADTFINLG